jgi:hypothetical protein
MGIIFSAGVAWWRIAKPHYNASTSGCSGYFAVAAKFAPPARPRERPCRYFAREISAGGVRTLRANVSRERGRSAGPKRRDGAAFTVSDRYFAREISAAADWRPPPPTGQTEALCERPRRFPVHGAPLADISRAKYLQEKERRSIGWGSRPSRSAGKAGAHDARQIFRMRNICRGHAPTGPEEPETPPETAPAAGEGPGHQPRPTRHPDRFADISHAKYLRSPASVSRPCERRTPRPQPDRDPPRPQRRPMPRRLGRDGAGPEGSHPTRRSADISRAKYLRALRCCSLP